MSKKGNVKNHSENNVVESKMPQIVCLPTSIKLFRFYGGFPPKDRLLNPGTWFYIKFILLAVCSSSVLVGSVLHLVKNIKGKCTA